MRVLAIVLLAAFAAAASGHAVDGQELGRHLQQAPKRPPPRPRPKPRPRPPRPQPPRPKPPRPRPPRPRPPRPQPPRPRPVLPGTTFGNAINLGSSATVKRNASSVGYPDTRLAGCADPSDYGNKKFGDGADVIFKYTAPYTGLVLVQACSDAFQVTTTIIGNGEDSDGLPIVNGTLTCGYFDSCSNNPDLFDPSTQTLLPVDKGEVIYIQVTGQASTDYGPYKIAVKTFKPGTDPAAAIYLGSDPHVSQAGDSTGLPDTYTNNCTAGKDGPDVFYSYSVNQTGLMRVKVCSDEFSPSFVLRSDSVAGTGNGEVQLPGCGSCDTPLTVDVKEGDFFYVVVSGGEDSGSGAFTVTIDNLPPATVGTNKTNAIDLGSGLVISRNDSTLAYRDTALSGCADPEYYNNQTFGDGGDLFYKYTVPFDGFINVQVCSDDFQVTTTLIGDGQDADGNNITDGTLTCGYFDSCSNNPDLFDPTTQTILPVTAGQVLYIQVTGQAGGDYGSFRLVVTMLKPGADEAAAIYLGNSTSIVAQAGDSTGLPDSYTNNCTAPGAADGADVWYSYSVPASGVLSVSACSAAFTPKVVLLTDSVAGTGNGEVQLPGCGTCGTPVSANATADSFFYIVVSGSAAGASGAFTLDLNLAASP